MDHHGDFPEPRFRTLFARLVPFLDNTLAVATGGELWSNRKRETEHPLRRSELDLRTTLQRQYVAASIAIKTRFTSTENAKIRYP